LLLVSTTTNKLTPTASIRRLPATYTIHIGPTARNLHHPSTYSGISSLIKMRTSLLTDITEQNDRTLEDSFYDNWRRQKKIYEMEIKTLDKKLNQMQEKLDILQQKQLQGDLGRGRNSINKSKFNKFDHINMETVSGFCKNKMFPVYKFLDHSMLIYSSNKQSLRAKLTGLIDIPKELNTPTDHVSIGQTA
jgi:hypothetical protein